MSEGPTQIAGNVVDALKQQPSTFAMIVMSFGLLGFTFYEGSSFNSQRLEMLKVVIGLQSETQQLLFKCAPVQQQNK